jgi:hypothetical protein
MHGLMTTGIPAGALGQAPGMIGTADEETGTGLLDKMAFQAKVRIPLREQLDIYRTVRVVTAGTAFAQRFVLEDKRALLGRMTAQAHVIFRKHRSAAAGRNGAFVRVVTVGTLHPAFGHGVVIGEIELSAHIQMAGVTDRFLRPRRLHRHVRAVTARLAPAGGERVGRLRIAA